MKEFSKEYILEKYTDYVVKNRQYPDIKIFTKSIKMSKKKFKDIFDSVESLKEKFWLFYFEETLKTLNESSDYQEYTVRDKMLAFYFTWIELLADFKEYISFDFSNSGLFRVTPFEFNKLKRVFSNYANSLLEEGKQTGEIASRPLIENKLKKIIGTKLLFIIKFWIKDKSENSIKTDAAIEKSVHLVFDILGRNIADATFDFGKFLFQNK